MALTLGHRWGEGRVGLGLSADGGVELFANPETGTWTLVLISPGGPTCMIGSGEAWSIVAEAPRTPTDGA